MSSAESRERGISERTFTLKSYTKGPLGITIPTTMHVETNTLTIGLG